MQIILEGVQVFVSELQGQPGGKVLEFVDPAGNRFTIPLDQTAARNIATRLTTSIMLAGGPLPPPRP